MEAIRENSADVVGGSALMTTSLFQQKDLICVLNEDGVSVLTIFGGAPCSQEWVVEIGGAGYFGGVCFYFEKDMELDSVVTSYRDSPDGWDVSVERIPGDLPFPGGTSVSFGRMPSAPGGGVFEIVHVYAGDRSVEDIGSASVAIAVG